MECKKYFQFDKRKFTQDGIVSFYLSGSGSFVITGPDWPPEAGFTPPEQDEKIAEEFLDAIFSSENADSSPLTDSNISSYADLPHHPDVLADWINNENTPFRWKYETGYKLKEISFSGFYPSDEKSTIRAGFTRKLGEVVRDINLILEKQKALVPGYYSVNDNGVVIFDWDRIDRSNTEFWELHDKCNGLFDQQMALLQELKSFKYDEIDELNTRSFELVLQEPDDNMREEINGILAEVDELTEEYERLCELLGEE